jgi:hypothetical protein
MPTTPMKAQPLPPAGCAREESFARALEMINNLFSQPCEWMSYVRYFKGLRS